VSPFCGQENISPSGRGRLFDKLERVDTNNLSLACCRESRAVETRRLWRIIKKTLKQSHGRGAALREVQLDLLKGNPKLHPFHWASLNGER
jgi:hypothetical protein